MVIERLIDDRARRLIRRLPPFVGNVRLHPGRGRDLNRVVARQQATRLILTSTLLYRLPDPRNPLIAAAGVTAIQRGHG